MKKLAALLCVGALTLAACGGGKTQTPGGTTGDDADHKSAAAACSPDGTSLKVTAKDTKFLTTCLAAPAGEAFTIELVNEDDFPHNVSIYTSKEHGDSLFEGKPFAEGMKSVTYNVPAIDKKGTFHFMCDIHPEMEGDFVVG